MSIQSLTIRSLHTYIANQLPFLILSTTNGRVCFNEDFTPADGVVGTKEQSIGAVKNMIGNVSGMICDGAKPSCSLKASTGVSSALISALLAMEGHAVTANEGIVEEDIDCCIRNLADLGRNGMAETDLKVLKIMTSKGRHG